MTQSLPPGFTLDTPEDDTSKKPKAATPPPGFVLDTPAPAPAAAAPATPSIAEGLKEFGPAAVPVAVAKGLKRAGLVDAADRGFMDTIASTLHTGADFVDQTIQAHNPLKVLADVQARANPNDAGAKRVAEIARDPLGVKQVADDSLAVHKEINKDREDAQARVGGRPTLEQFKEHPLDAIEQGAAYYGNMGAESAPAMAAAVATRNPELASNLLGITSGAQQYTDDRSQGVGRGAAALDAAVNAAAEKTGEEFSLPFVLDDAAMAAEKSAGKRLLHATLAEAGQEVPTQLIQTQAQDLATGHETSVEDQLLGALDAGVVGGAMGAGAHVGVHAAQAVLKPKGPLERVADGARAQQQQFSDAAQEARARAAQATQFEDPKDLSATIETLRSQAEDPRLPPETRAGALQQLQSLVESHGRMLPPPDGFTVDSAGNATRGAPRRRPEIAPGARAPGDFGPGMTEQAPGPKPQPSYAEDKTVLDGDRTTTSGKPFATEAGASRHLKSAFDGKGQLTQVDGGWVVRPPLATTTPAAAASASAPDTAPPPAPAASASASADQTPAPESASRSEPKTSPSAGESPASTEAPPHKSGGATESTQKAAPAAESPADQGTSTPATPPLALSEERRTQLEGFLQSGTKTEQQLAKILLAEAGPRPTDQTGTGPQSAAKQGASEVPADTQATPPATPAATAPARTGSEPGSPGPAAGTAAAETQGGASTTPAAASATESTPETGTASAQPAPSPESADSGASPTGAAASTATPAAPGSAPAAPTAEAGSTSAGSGASVASSGVTSHKGKDTTVTNEGAAKAAATIPTKDGGYRPGDTFQANGREWRVESAAHTGTHVGAVTTSGTLQRDTFAVGDAKAAAIDAAAAQAATHPDSTPAPPTEAQKEAGNYQKGHITLHGMGISIENPAGTKRNEAWPPLAHHYGYIKGTIGKDKDHIDVFLTQHAHDAERPVFVIDQRNKAGGFDEHKVILGAATADEAKAAYKANYSPGWKGLGAVTQMTLGQFREWSRMPHMTQLPAKQAKFDSDFKAETADMKAGVTEADREAAAAKARAEYAAKATSKDAGARNAQLAPGAQTTELPWPTKGWKGSPSAQISVSKGENGWHFMASYQTNSTGHGGPFSEHHYASAAEARGAAVDAIRAQLPKNPEGVEKQHVARINDWLAKQDVGTKPAAAEVDKKPAALRTLGYTDEQIAAMPDAQQWHIVASVGAGVGPGVSRVTSPLPANPTPKWKAYERKADAAQAKMAAETPPPKLTAKQQRAATVELERSTFTALANDTAWIGKSVQELVAEIRTRVDAAHTPAATVLKMATGIHKQLAKNAVELEKAKHRDPAVYAAHVAEAAGARAGEERAQFDAGFAHAMAGRTKSSMVGDRLPDMLAGYQAAIDWRKTEEGKAFFEGRPVAKLENTGTDLRRHWEALRAQAMAAQTDTVKAWAEISKATNRADLFAPLFRPGQPPGLVKFLTDLRGEHRTFTEWLSDQFSWYGSYNYKAGSKALSGENLKYMLEGRRYPSERRAKLDGGREIDEEQFKTDERYRIDFLQGLASDYLAAIQPLVEALDGVSSVADAAAKIDAAMFKPGLAAEFLRQQKMTLQQRAALKEQGLERLHYEREAMNEAGKALQKARVFQGKTKPLTHFTPTSYFTEALTEKEATYELPTKATPLTAPKLDHVIRTGLTDQRKGRNVTPAEFKAAFGFADVGFGKWVGSKQDQDHLNYSFDAFMDLAAHMGIKPEQIGLGGVLHYTIGALGSGKASAHFWASQPHPNGGTVQVINVTNTRGDGTVYHEWIHALDHNLGGDWKRVRRVIQEYFTRSRPTVEEVNAYANRFLFEGTYWKGDKGADKVKAAAKGMDYLAGRGGTATAYKRNSDALGADYWGNEAELLARASEAWSGDTLGGTNTYLVNPGWSGDGATTSEKGYRGTPYPSGHERQLFNQVLDALRAALSFDENGKPTVSWTKFEAALPADAGEQRRLALSDPENMRIHFEEEQARRAAIADEQQSKAAAAAAREAAEIERLAQEALAALPPPVVDPPKIAEIMGALSEADYEALFDEVAAEAREEGANDPKAEPPGMVVAPATSDAEQAVTLLDALTPEQREVVREELSEPGRPLTDAQLNAALREQIQLAPQEALATLSMMVKQTPAAKPAPVKSATAAALVAEAAKHGVTGVDEAMQGLAAIFGAGKGRLNSFPSGFDEEAYKAAKPHFEKALAQFQEAGKNLKDLFRMLLDTWGDGIKQYAVRFAKDMQLSTSLGQATSASATMAQAVAERLRGSEPMEWRELFAIADKAWGGTQGEGAYTPKDAYDALEAGVNQYLMANGNAFSPNTDATGAAIVTARLQELVKRLPTQTKRTAEQDEFQQFSTVPPLAFIANWVANVTPADTLLEPSAGIGGLAVFAKIAGAQLVLNELSSRRAAVLQEVFPGARVFHENAEHIDRILPADVTPSVVVMNPPFSATAGRLTGERSTKIGAQHVEQALDRLPKGGRLVAIVGDGMRLDAPAFRDWWAKIQAKHTVRAVVPVSGKGYAKYGTTFDNVLLVIDKVAGAERSAPIVTPVEDYTQLVGLLNGIRNDRPAANLPRTDSTAASDAIDAAESARAEPVPAGADSNAGTPPAVGAAAVGAGIPAGAGSGVDAGGRGRGGQARGGKPGRAGAGAGNAVAAGSGNAQAGGDGAAAGSGGPGQAGHTTGVSTSAVDAVAGELTDSTFEGYQPQRLQVPGAKAHPGPLVQSAAMAAVLPPSPTYTPNLPAETITEGKLSIAQIEAVVYAGQAHNETLPNGERRGFFIGDGTGVGKGREIGGIILDNLRQGRGRAVWVTEKQDLEKDAKRDFAAVGGDPALVFNHSKTPASGQLPARDGVLFTTYDTLRSGSSLGAASTNSLKPFKKGDVVLLDNGTNVGVIKALDLATQTVSSMRYGQTVKFGFDRIASVGGDTQWRDKLPKPKPGAAQSRLQQLVAYLGPDFDGVIAFDEAHNAGNAVAMKGERGSTKPSEKALAVVELQKLLPKARVVYVSATGATTVNNLAYANRLGLWGAGTAFPSVQEFVAEMTAGGLATMELVARDMKQMGAYLARSLSFDGVTYSRLEHTLSPLQEDIYNKLAEAWQVVLANMEQALELTGATKEGATQNSRAVSAMRSAFWGTQQRFFNQVITSMQMPTVLAQIHADIAAGDAVVLQLVNTNEAQQERALAKQQDEGEDALEDLDLTPRDALISMVLKAFPVVQMQSSYDSSGNKVTTPVTDSTGKPVENKDAVAMRDKLIADLEQIRVPDGPLESLLNEFGPDAVAEVTGRSQRTYMAEDKDGNRRLKIDKRGAGSNDKDAQAFLADKKKILVFSDAGGTGYSFHADNTKVNRRKRQHYLLQPGWRADKAVQGLGRTHRTNEASQPHYRLVATNIPAHKRFLSAIARRLDMLGAMTKGQRDTAGGGLFSEKDNLESKYATQAVRQLLEDIKAGQVEGIELMPFLTELGMNTLIDPNTGWIPDTKFPPTRQFLNRMLSLTLPMQEKVFGAFIARMEEKIEVAAQRGELDAGMQTVRAQSTRIVQDEVVYTDPRTGAQTRYVELELTLPQVYRDFPEGPHTGEIQWLVNKASGKLWGAVKSGTDTLSNGAIVDRYRMYSTTGITVKNAKDVTGPARAEHYDEIDQDTARVKWAAEEAAKPPTFTRPAHMIVGAMLPIWDRIKTEGTLQVLRTQTSDGQRLLGKMILPKDVAEIRKRLNVGHPAAKMAPAELMAAILKGETATLANGWTITRAKVSDELRIELKTPALYGPAMTELRDMGVIGERIDWRERNFIPTGAAGVPVLQALLKSKPVVDLTSPTSAVADAEEGHALLRRRDEGGRFTHGMPVEAVQAIVDRLASQWHGLKAAGFTIHVHDTFADLPKGLQREALRQGSQPHQTLGLFRGNELHIVAANARKGAAGVEETIFHEAYGHAGLRLIFGRGTQGEMVKIAKAIGGLDGMQRYAKANGIDLSDYVRDTLADKLLSHDQKLGVLMDELLAHIAEKGEPTLRQRVLELLGKVKEWLRDNGFATLAKYDAADIARLLQRSRQAVQGKGEVRVRTNEQTGLVAQQRDATPDLDELLAEHGERVVSTMDAQRRWNAGERLFGTHEQAEGEATEITSHDMLRGYEPDQLLALPRSLAAQLGLPETRLRDEHTTPDTPGFKAWFADSKVTTPNGRPLLVFHGTGDGFWSFSKEHLAGATGHMSSPLGFFFDENIAKAEAYARNAARDVPADERVIDAYLSIQNPKVMTLDELLAIDNLEEARALRAKLIAQGYDGIHQADNHQWIAFEPSQIKSASLNNGNFDSRDDDIRFSRAPTANSGVALDNLEQGIRGSSQRAFERIKSAGENWRPALLGALTLRHLGELGAKIMPLIAKYQTVVDQMNVDRNDLMHKAAGTADAWADLQASKPREAVEMASLMHDTTLAGVDPSRDFLPGMLPASRLGPAEAISPASINARIQKLTAERARTDNPEHEHRLDEQIQRLRDTLAEEAARRRQYPELVARWTDLPREAQQLYVRVRDAYAEMSQHTLDALVTRIMKLEATEAQKEALVDRMRLSFEEARIHAPYFPLARFGDFWTSAEDASGERAFFMYESHRAWKQAQVQLKRDGYTILDTGRKLDKQRLIDGASGAFVAQVQTLLEDANVDDDTRDEVYQLYLRTLPDLSARKHFIHRKGVEGYSNDALRAFGSNMFHGAFQIARLRHTQELANLMAAMEKTPAALTDPEDKQKAGALYNEMVKRHDWILNPRDSALVSKISAFNFVYYLGMTPAAAVVNLTQTAMIALPVLGSRYGYRAANRELLKTMKLAGQAQLKNDFGDRLNGDEAEAYKTWIRLGIIDVTQAHALAEIGQTDSTQFNRTAHKAMAATSFLFHRAEMLNRQATALAAYRLARRGGLGHEAATDYAGKATLEAHFDYSNANRARFMQSGTAKVLLAFRQYSLNMTWFLARNAQQSYAGLTKEERSEARQKLLGALGMTGLFAGATGLPLMWAVFGIFNMLHSLFGDDDDPWDAETAFKNWAVETLGHWGGTALTEGLVNATAGVDLSSRVSLNNIWLREADRDLEGKAQYDYYLEQAAGPVGGMFANAARGAQLIHEGQLYRGIETMVPKALRDAMKMARYSKDGVNTLRGDPLVPDVSVPQLVAQFAGFTPAEVAQQQDANTAVINYQNAIEKRRGSLLDGFAMALRMEDGEAMEKGLEKIQSWNQHHPEYPIDQATIQRSLAARARASAQAENGIRLNPRLRDRAMQEGAFAE